MHLVHFNGVICQIINFFHFQSELFRGEGLKESIHNIGYIDTCHNVNVCVLHLS